MFRALRAEPIKNGCKERVQRTDALSLSPSSIADIVVSLPRSPLFSIRGN